jgi:dienelactone hydrolase
MNHLIPSLVRTFLLCCFLILPMLASGESMRAMSFGADPDDIRLGPLKDLNGYFPFTPPATLSQWKIRSSLLRKRMLVALGLWPLPTKTPLHAVIHGKLDFGDYTVEKVYFESMPGFFVTGSLYRPKTSGRHPAVLSPHGHWPNGRFMDVGEEAVKADIASGAERFADGGRSPLQARCVELARLGCVVFLYDMIGYADSVLIPYSVAHGFDKQRPEMNTERDWGLFSAQAEAHLQSVMGLQTWNSIRALDFLSSLPDVDPHRIAVTGASGGGTQTFILCAIDPRPAVAFPAVMVSTAMQGGCTCENACDLRIGTSNVEFAALFAPKPLGMTAADDWTKEMPTKGYPELKRLYAMYGKPRNVKLWPFLQFGHNYNMVSREAMYGWMNEHLHLEAKEPIEEREYHLLSPRDLTVWDKDHPAPPGGEEFERRLLAWWNEDSQKTLNRSLKDEKSYRRVYGDAIRVLIGRDMDDAGEVDWISKYSEKNSAYTMETGLIRNLTYHEELPALLLVPRVVKRNPVIWIDAVGKKGVLSQEGTPRRSVLKLLDSGAPVIGVDLLYQGEFLKDGQAANRQRIVSNDREDAAYTFGYNDSLFAQRVHDILSTICLARKRFHSARVDMVGWNGGGIWVGATCAVANGSVGAVAMDTEGFRFGHLLDYRDPNFLPGGAKYGDLLGMIALHAPDPLWLAGETEDGVNFIRRQYNLSHSRDIFIYHGGKESEEDAATDWLLAH